MDDNQEQFVCEFPGCGIPYNFKQGLSRHQRTQHKDWIKPNKYVKGEGGFPCNICQKDYSTEESRRKHKCNPILIQPIQQQQQQLIALPIIQDEQNLIRVNDNQIDIGQDQSMEADEDINGFGGKRSLEIEIVQEEKQYEPDTMCNTCWEPSQSDLIILSCCGKLIHQQCWVKEQKAQTEGRLTGPAKELLPSLQDRKKAPKTCPYCRAQHPVQQTRVKQPIKEFELIMKYPDFREDVDLTYKQVCVGMVETDCRRQLADIQLKLGSLSLKRLQLMDHSLLSLQGENSIHYQIIDACSKLLNLEQAAQVYCFSSWFWHWSQLKEFDKCMFTLQRDAIFLLNYKMLLMPLLDNNHWTLLCCELEQETFYIIDSDLPCKNPKTLVNPFKQLIKNYSQIDVSSWHIVIYNKTPQQSNKFDCGMCLIKNMSLLGQYQNINSLSYVWTGEYSVQFRHHIKTCLIYSKRLNIDATTQEINNIPYNTKSVQTDVELISLPPNSTIKEEIYKNALKETLAQNDILRTHQIEQLNKVLGKRKRECGVDIELQTTLEYVEKNEIISQNEQLNYTDALNSLLLKLDTAYKMEQKTSKMLTEQHYSISGGQSIQMKDVSDPRTYEVTDIVNEIDGEESMFGDINTLKDDQSAKYSISSRCGGIKKERRFQSEVKEQIAQLVKRMQSMELNQTKANEKIDYLMKRTKDSEAAFDGLIQNELLLCGYKMIRCVGQGSFGKVYECSQKNTYKKTLSNVAVKVSHRPRCDLTAEIACLQKIKDASPINSQFVVSILKMFQVLSKQAFVMEFLPLSLTKAMSLKKQFSIEQKRQLACNILRGIQAGHQIGIFHKDLKPANIMIDCNNVAKVCDWGLSDGLRGCGTSIYQAPEIFNHQMTQIDFGKVDSWAVGLILYWMFEGKELFSKDQVNQLHQQQLKTIELIFSDSTPLLAIEMITKLLQVEPKERMTVAQAVNHQWFTGISIFQATGFSNSNPLSHAGMGPPKYSPSKGQEVEEEKEYHVQTGSMQKFDSRLNSSYISTVQEASFYESSGVKQNKQLKLTIKETVNEKSILKAMEQLKQHEFITFAQVLEVVTKQPHSICMDRQWWGFLSWHLEECLQSSTILRVYRTLSQVNRYQPRVALPIRGVSLEKQLEVENQPCDAQIDNDIQMEGEEQQRSDSSVKQSNSSLDEKFDTMELLIVKWAKKGKDRVVCNQCNKEKYWKYSNSQFIVIKGQHKH